MQKRYLVNSIVGGSTLGIDEAINNFLVRSWSYEYLPATWGTLVIMLF